MFPTICCTNRWTKHITCFYISTSPFSHMNTLDGMFQLTLDGIKQFYVSVEREDWKLETLIDLYDTLSITQAVIFCNTRRKVLSLFYLTM